MFHTRVNTWNTTPASRVRTRTCGTMHYTHAFRAMCATTLLSLAHLHHAPSGACAQLAHICTIMCVMILTKIDPRQGGCLGLCTLVYESVMLKIIGHTPEVRSTTEFDNQRYKRRSIGVMDATPARMQITEAQYTDYARIVISTTGLILTECCQSVQSECVSCCTAAVTERD